MLCYEQGVGLKSPITVDTDFRKDSRIGLYRMMQVGLPVILTWGQVLADQVDQQGN